MRHSSMRLERARPDEVAVEELDADVTLDINALAEATPGRGFQDFAPLHLISMSTMRAIANSAELEDLTWLATGQTWLWKCKMHRPSARMAGSIVR